MHRNQQNKPRSDEDKLTNITEILELLEEKGRSKGWILRELKRHKVKLNVPPTNSVQILKSCPQGVISHLLRVLKGDEFEDFKEIQTLTKTYHWFYTDIVGSSNPAVLIEDQARKVCALNELIGRTETFKQRDPMSDVMMITGDGMVIGFSNYPEKPLRLAIELSKLIFKYNQLRSDKDKLHIRVGIDTGLVYIIKDVMNKDNYWGPGIIVAKRIMDLARSKQILASERIAVDISKLTPENKSVIHYAGEYKTKHGEILKIYNIYGVGWGNKLDPPRPIVKEKDPTKRFSMPKIEIRLDVTDPKTKMTHHTFLWHVVNISKEPIEEVSYFIVGEKPKKFPDLNVTVKDEGEGKQLKIMSLPVNKPLLKEFIVKLNKPLKPNQDRSLKMEYDWEEPEKFFEYVIPTDCKKFKFLFTIPKGIEIKQRVLKVDSATRYKTYASPSPEIKYLNNRTEVSWQASNLHAYEQYRLEW